MLYRLTLANALIYVAFARREIEPTETEDIIPHHHTEIIQPNGKVCFIHVQNCEQSTCNFEEISK